MSSTALVAKDTSPTTGTVPPESDDRNSTGKQLIREIAMDIGKDVAAYIEVMFPKAVAGAASSGFLLSVRNHTYNQIMAALDVEEESAIRSRLSENKRWRREWKAMYRKMREKSGKDANGEETEVIAQALIEERNQPEKK